MKRNEMKMAKIMASSNNGENNRKEKASMK
jgi:hypothetical protein